MRRVLPVLLVVLLLCGCGAAAKSWQEEYDLGVRYLSEGNYEEAILAFEAAIEIDPKRAEAYLSLADVYVAQGDLDAAREVLDRAVEAVGEDEEVLAKIEELGGSPGGASPGGTSAGGAAAEGNEAVLARLNGLIREISAAVVRTERFDFEGDDPVQYQTQGYDANDNLIVINQYLADGVCLTNYSDTHGNDIVGLQYAADGSVEEYFEYEVDGNGNVVRMTIYQADGRLDCWVDSGYDGDNILRSRQYEPDGTLYCVMDYDSQGNVSRSTYYKPDGTVDYVEEGN